MSDSFKLRTFGVGALPIVQHYITRLGVDVSLERAVPTSDRRVAVPHAAVLGVLLRNLVLGRTPLYAVREWTDGYDTSLLGYPGLVPSMLNDDRLGRALDRLYDADRSSLMTEIVVRAIQKFEIDVTRFHNDSTSITFSGEYRGATGKPIRGKKACAIVHGHNKDHRPDLKQLLWILTVSADGAVPVHYRLCDGNTSDDPTHIDTWEALRLLVGRPDFLYIADSKLCSRENMDHLDQQGGRFISVLPRSRKEDTLFREYVLSHELAWEEVVRRPNPRNSTGVEEIWRVVEGPLPSSEGYRIVWVWSSLLARKQAAYRLDSLKKALAGVDILNKRLSSSRCRLRSRSAVEDAAEAVLTGAKAGRWADIIVVEESDESFKQAAPGRPGPNTKYTKKVRSRFSVVWQPKADVIANSAKSDGMFPLITNDRKMPAREILSNYKAQPYLEKRHEQLKSIYAVTPAFLKNEGRIEALLFLFFVALLLQALVEREVRRRMKSGAIKSLPLYPEERACRAPTANRIFDVFAPLQRHELQAEDDEVVQKFSPELTRLQSSLLQLAGVPVELFR